jgi:hypothetical protein
MHAPDDRTPALVATVVVAALTLLSRDAEGVPKILDVIEFAANERGHWRNASNAKLAGSRQSDDDPAAASGLVRFEGVGAAPTEAAFTAIAVLYTVLRACERLHERMWPLYLRVARVVLRNVHEDARAAHAVLDEDVELKMLLGRVLDAYERVDGPKSAERCADKMHAFLVRAAKEESAFEAAMRAVSSALAALKIIAAG